MQLLKLHITKMKSNEEFGEVVSISGVAWHGPSRALARPLEMLLGPRWSQGPT